MKVKITVGLLVLAIACGCSSKKQTLPSIEVTQKPLEKEDYPNIKLEVTADVLTEGKSLYGMHCAKCHELFEPKSFTAEEWKPIVLRMQKEANISDTEREKIYAYLTTPQM